MATQPARKQKGRDLDAAALAARLLDWYDRHARVLPWRTAPHARGARPDPYRVWLSEIMLQQTTVVTVGPYFGKFLARWPTVDVLAAAALDDVLSAWAGLGYYARARNLHKCARHVAEKLGGRFPDTEEGLRELPGIGPYTAAAIAAIAFDRPTVVVDGNVERVMSRLFAIATPLPAAKPALHAAASRLATALRPGDYAQAVMDLGATVCTPRNPRCMLCPWAEACQAREGGSPEQFPYRSPKAERPTKRAIVFVLLKDGAVWLRRRAEDGLLGGMLEAPSTPWRPAAWRDAAALEFAPVAAAWKKCGAVQHGFTHFIIEFDVRSAVAGKRVPDEGAWCRLDNLDQLALPTLTRKVLAQALAQPAVAQPDRQLTKLRAKSRIMTK
jgi:A/G-specific adenine glycosylase